MFQQYVAECLRISTENTAKYVGGSYMKIHYSEIIGETKQDTSVEKDPEEIKSKILDHFGNKEAAE